MADERVIIEVEVDSEQARKNAASLLIELERQRKELRDLRKAYKDGKISAEDFGEQAASLQREIQKNSKAFRDEQRAVETNSNSLQALAAETARLTAERKNLDTSTQQGIDRYEELTRVIDENTATLKEQEKRVGDTRRNVGNYAAAINEAFEQNNIFNGVLGDARAAFTSFTGGIKTATTGLSGLKLAFAALGIGLVIAAIGTLVAFFTRTRKGAQQLERILGGLSGVFNKIVQDIAAVGEIIFETFINLPKIFQDIKDSITSAFSDPLKSLEDFGNAIIENIVNRAKGIVQVFDSIANFDFKNPIESAKTLGNNILQVGTGVENVIDKTIEFGKNVVDTLGEGAEALQGYGADLAKAAEQGFNLADSNIALRNQIRALTSAQAEATFQAEANRKLRDDETKSEAERLAFNEKVLEFETKRTEAQKALNAARVQLIQNEIAAQGGLATATEAQLDQLAELERERFEILEDFEGRTTEVLTERVSIQRDAALKRVEAEQAAVDAELAIFEARNNAILNAEENLTQERQQAITQRLKLQVDAARAAAETEKQAIENDVRDAQQRAAQIKLIEANLQKTIAELNRSTNDELKAINDNRTQITQEEANRRLSIEQDTIQARLALVTEGSQEETDLLNQLAENNRQQRIAEAEATIQDAEELNARLSLINAEYQAEVQESSSAIQQARSTEANEALGAAQTIAQAATDQTLSEEERKKAVLSAVTDIIAAKIREAVATQIANAIATVPFPANIIVATAASVALEVLLSKILGGIQGFASGGVVSGGTPISRPNGDNVLITAKKGEVILNQRQQSFLGSGALKMAGVPGFADGGVVGGLPSSAIVATGQSRGIQQTEMAFMQAVESLPAPVLDYKQFTLFEARVAQSTQRAQQ